MVSVGERVRSRAWPQRRAGLSQSEGLTLGEALAFLALVSVIAWIFGNYSRFPFDDEAYTLSAIEGVDLRHLFVLFLNGYDVHPLLSYMFFGVLAHCGFGPPAMRAASLLLTALSFLVVLDTTLPEVPADAPFGRRVTLFVFATVPLLYGAGDALRWYPPFAALVAIFFWLCVRRDRPTVGAGLALGLAASTNYIAIFPYLAFAVRRYLVQRRFALGNDGAFHLAVLATAWPGLWTFTVVVGGAWRSGHALPHLTDAPVQRGVEAIGQALLGFLGGYRLGILHSVLALPYLALLLLGLVVLAREALRERDRTSRRSSLLLFFGLNAGLTLLYSFFTGFEQGRSYLFLAPFAAAILTLGYWRSPLGRYSPIPLFLAAFLLFGGALANAHASNDPFKRDLSLPFAEIKQFIADNTSGDVLFASASSTAAYLMRGPDVCTTQWNDEPPPCMQDLGRFRYIVIGRNENFAGKKLLNEIDRYARSHRTLTARARFGLDRAAGLKTRLTGVPVDPWGLEVEVYR